MIFQFGFSKLGQGRAEDKNVDTCPRTQMCLISNYIQNVLFYYDSHQT
jgi:hypothetical protein